MDIWSLDWFGKAEAQIQHEPYSLLGSWNWKAQVWQGRSREELHRMAWALITPCSVSRRFFQVGSVTHSGLFHTKNKCKSIGETRWWWLSVAGRFESLSVWRALTPSKVPFLSTYWWYYWSAGGSHGRCCAYLHLGPVPCSLFWRMKSWPNLVMAGH